MLGIDTLRHPHSNDDRLSKRLKQPTPCGKVDTKGQTSAKLFWETFLGLGRSLPLGIYFSTMSDAVLVSHSTSQSGSTERAHRAPSATSASELDLLCLIHDISVLQKESPSTYSKCVQNVRQRFSDIPKNRNLIHFIIKHPDLYIHKEIRRLPYPASCYAINWVWFSHLLFATNTILISDCLTYHSYRYSTIRGLKALHKDSSPFPLYYRLLLNGKWITVFILSANKSHFQLNIPVMA